jgi:hypothetical protein
VLTSTFPKGVNDSTPPFVFQLCSHLLPHFDLTVLAPAVRHAPQTETLQGVKVRRFHYFWPRSLERLADGAILESLSRSPWLFLQVPFLLLSELIAAFRLARTARPDVIHAHWFVPQGIVAVLAGLALRGGDRREPRYGGEASAGDIPPGRATAGHADGRRYPPLLRRTRAW